MGYAKELENVTYAQGLKRSKETVYVSPPMLDLADSDSKQLL